MENSPQSSQDQLENLDVSAFKILCVDDEPNILAALRRMFMLSNFVVEEATSGAEALRKLEQQEFHLVLSDMQMPEMNNEIEYRSMYFRFSIMHNNDLYLSIM